MAHLPALTDWDATKNGLHRAAQVVAAFRKAYSPKLPNALHLSLYIRDFGLTTGPLSFGHIDFFVASGALKVTTKSSSWTVELLGKTPKSLHEALVNSLLEHGVSRELPANEDSAPFGIDMALAADYNTALWRVSGALRELRADFLGAVTPLVVWPHGFDASELWFPGANPDEHKEPHLNFGFSPGSAGLPRPYVYAYASPMPEGLVGTALPALAHWHTQGWTGVVIDYDPLAALDNPEADLADALRGIYALMAGKLEKPEKPEKK